MRTSSLWSRSAGARCAILAGGAALGARGCGERALRSNAVPVRRASSPRVCCAGAVASSNISVAAAATGPRRARFPPRPRRGSSSDAPVAIARFLAAMLAARLLAAPRRKTPPCTARRRTPSARGARRGASGGRARRSRDASLGLRFDPAHLSPIGNALLGAALGFAAAPCGLGAVALAGALRARAPDRGSGISLHRGHRRRCVRFVARSHRDARVNDAFAYALLAVGARDRRGAPRRRARPSRARRAAARLCGRRAPATRSCTAASAAPRHASRRALMLAGALLGAAPPQYRATETTLTDLFAGERLTFTGALVRDWRRKRRRALRDYLLPRRRRAGRGAARSGSAVCPRARGCALADGRKRQRRAASRHNANRTRSPRRSTRLSIVMHYARVCFRRGSSSSTGMPLGSSTNAIARVPLGDL